MHSLDSSPERIILTHIREQLEVPFVAFCQAKGFDARDVQVILGRIGFDRSREGEAKGRPIAGVRVYDGGQERERQGAPIPRSATAMTWRVIFDVFAEGDPSGMSVLDLGMVVERWISQTGGCLTFDNGVGIEQMHLQMTGYAPNDDDARDGLILHMVFQCTLIKDHSIPAIYTDALDVDVRACLV